MRCTAQFSSALASVAQTIPRQSSGCEDFSHHFELVFGFLIDDQGPFDGQDRQLIEAPMPPFRPDLVRLSQGNQMPDRPGDNVAIPLKIAFAPHIGSEDTSNVLRD